MNAKAHFSVFAGFALAVTAGTQSLDAAVVVDVNATNLGVADGTVVAGISNSGTAGNFTTVTGSVTTITRDGFQGLNFDGASKMTAANLAGAVGLSGNASYSITSWVWNDNILNEEAIVAWGRRGGPDGTNAGFHQGVHPAFGALGHWGGGPDVGWGNDGADINATVSRWAHLAVTFDGNESRVFIDGVLSNSEAHGALNVHAESNPISIGSENDNGNPLSTPIGFSGTIGTVKVWDETLSDAAILADYNQGIPEPSTAVLSLVGLLSLLSLRRRR